MDFQMTNFTFSLTCIADPGTSDSRH